MIGQSLQGMCLLKYGIYSYGHYLFIFSFVTNVRVDAIWHPWDLIGQIYLKLFASEAASDPTLLYVTEMARFTVASVIGFDKKGV